MALNFLNNGYVAGDLGVGTDSPGTINGVAFSSVGLHVKAGTLGRTITEGTSWGEYIMNHSGASANQRAKFIQSKAGNFNLGSYDDNGTQRVHMTVLNAGNVGIGTNSPDSKLDIEDSNPFVTIQGSSASYVNAGVQFISNHASTARGLGNFYYSAHSDVEWFSGLPYNGNDAFVINRNINYTVPSSQSSPAGIGASAGTLLKVDSAGAIQFNNYSGTNKTGTPTYMLGTDADGNVVKVLGGSIPGGGTVTGSGTATYLPKWGSTGSDLTDSIIYESTGNNVRVGKSTSTANFLVYPEQTQAPTNKKYLFHIDGSTNGVGLGYWGGVDSTYGSVVEGIKLIPSNLADHVLTRITPRLEVYPYENPADTTDNTYVTGFVGSSFSIGSENTIGDSGSTNLGIIGFNNKLTGDKMLIVGQGNEVQGNNVSSILVGTTNTLVAGPGQILNSAVVGQNHSIGHSLIRSTYSGINNQTTGNATNVLIAGSGLKISGNNSSVLGANNEIESASNATVGGFNNEIKNNSSSDNINYYGTAMFGWSNSAQNSSSSTNNTKSSLIVGRNNDMRPNSKGAIESMIVGGYNNYVYSGADRGLVVGSNNVIIGNGSLTSQDTPDVSVFDSSIVAGNTNYVDAIDSILVGRANGSYNTGGGATTYYPIRGKELLIIGNNHESNFDSTKGCFAIGNNNTIASGSSGSAFIGAQISGGGNNTLYVGSSHSGNAGNSFVTGQNNNFNPSGFSGTASQLSLMAGRGNRSKGTLSFTLGSSNFINGSSSGNNFILGNTNQIGQSNPSETPQKNVLIGFNNASRLNNKILIGKNLWQFTGASAGSDDCVVLGENNDYADSHYDKTGLSPALIVGASTVSGTSSRRDALIITNRTSSSRESCVILPTVGKNHNYPNDASAAIGGVPLYGVYHNNGNLKIRLTSDTGFTSYSSSIRYTTQSGACAGTANQTYYHSGTSTYPVVGDTCMSRSGSGAGNYVFTKLTGGYYLLGNSGLIQINSVGVMIASVSCPNELIDFEATGPGTFNSVCTFGTSLPTPTTTYYHDGEGTFPVAGEKMFTNSAGTTPAAAGYYYLYDAGCENVYVKITASDGTVQEQTYCTVC